LADILWQIWPGTDQAHLTQHNVDQLRQLIQLPFAEKPAKSTYASILVPCEAWAPHLRDHGAKLYEREENTMSADSLLAIEDRSGRGALHEQRNHQQDGKN